jgi:hypothetical protein
MLSRPNGGTMGERSTGGEAPVPAPRNGPPAPGRRVESPDDYRCLCGNLLARWHPDGLELNCRRCKRMLVIPLPPAARRR